MKRKILLIMAIVLVVLISSAWAADLLGRWIAQVPGGQERLQTVFNFRVDGTALLGTVSGPQGEIFITEGKISGDQISFYTVRSSAGKEINLVYKGRVAGDEIAFTLTGTGIERPVTFVAKREFRRNGDVPADKMIPRTYPYFQPTR